jgi:hypothetical protein
VTIAAIDDNPFRVESDVGLAQASPRRFVVNDIDKARGTVAGRRRGRNVRFRWPVYSAGFRGVMFHYCTTPLATSSSFRERGPHINNLVGIGSGILHSTSQAAPLRLVRAGSDAELGG